MHALREQAESGGDKVAVCGWYVPPYDVSSWWTAEEGQKRPDEQSQDEGTKPKKTRVDRDEVVGFFRIFICAWCFEVIRCVLHHKVWVAIYRDIMSRIMRYHKIRYIEISYHIYIPIFLNCYGDIVSRRINFSIPNTIFCQLGAPKHDAAREQKKWLIWR